MRSVLLGGIEKPVNGFIISKLDMAKFTEEDINGLRKAGKAVAHILWEMINYIRPGINTLQVDEFAGKIIEKFGAKSAPKEEGFPGNTCISVNNIIAHGRPCKRMLRCGDMINLDVSASLNGYYGDVAYTFILGARNEEAEKLCQCAKTATMKAINLSRPGIKLNEIARQIEQEARENSYTIIKNLCSHGVGKALHAFPATILNYYDPNESMELEEGMVIAWEPYISSCATRAIEGCCEWDFTTHNNSMVAQFEHTILITDDKPEILTTL